MHDVLLRAQIADRLMTARYDHGVNLSLTADFAQVALVRLNDVVRIIDSDQRLLIRFQPLHRSFVLELLLLHKVCLKIAQIFHVLNPLHKLLFFIDGNLLVVRLQFIVLLFEPLDLPVGQLQLSVNLVVRAI